ncbi:calcium-binding protein [Tateyamaria sp.]|uniref:calcium-binding protein n=1 Tax=Tateyamaria sp. TaxID=1929288 RepID=UPI0032A03F2F
MTGDGSLLGGTGNDTIEGHEDNDIGRGQDGNDVLRGGLGEDMLYGDAGNDTLAGGDGDDSLFGGIGDDVLNGAAGADTFVFSGSDFGNDTIDNFAISAASAEHDVLVFVANTGEVADFAAFVAASDQVGSDIVYDLGDDGLNTITIRNTFLANMTADDFDVL